MPTGDSAMTFHRFFILIDVELSFGAWARSKARLRVCLKLSDLNLTFLNTLGLADPNTAADVRFATLRDGEATLHTPHRQARSATYSP